MVTINENGNMCTWELQKAGYLLTVAGKLGMDVSGYGELAINLHSGYTYLWLEDYCFTLYMPISCKLKEEDVCVLWDNPINGEETEKSLSEFNVLSDIEDWATELYNKAESEWEEEED